MNRQTNNAPFLSGLRPKGVNRNAIIAVTMLTCFLSLGASAADGISFGDQAEPQGPLDQPRPVDLDAARNRALGGFELYDLGSDVLPRVGSSGVSSGCDPIERREFGPRRVVRGLREAYRWVQVFAGAPDRCEETNVGSVVGGSGAIRFEVLP